MARSLTDEKAARARAAITYAGISRKAIAKVLDVSVATVRRIEEGRPKTNIEELYKIADACDVPRSFMDRGFGDDDVALAARIEQLEVQMDAIAAHIIQEQAAAGVPARQRLRFPPNRQPAVQAPPGSRRRAR